MTTADALAWLLTYALHSTLLLGGVWLLTERGGVRSHRLRDLFWKTAKLCSAVKQEISLEHAQELMDNIKRVHEIFWETKGKDVPWYTAS